MEIKYQLVGDSTLFKSIEELNEYFGWNDDRKCRKYSEWFKNNVIEIDVHSDEYIMKDIPQEFHKTLSHMAYEKGHSCGCDEVREILIGLVADLKKPIVTFEERIRDEYTRDKVVQVS